MNVTDFLKGKEFFLNLKKYLQNNNISFTIGVEGALNPVNLDNNRALEILNEQIANTDYKIAIDVAATHLKKPLIISDYTKLVDTFNVFSLEDPFGEDDWVSWQNLMKTLGNRITIVGDDLITTNYDRVEKAIKLAACNGVVIKPNQIGTVSDSLKVIEIAKRNNLKTIVSHRGFETLDSFIADLAFYQEIDFVKFGGIEQPERLAKYNRLADLWMNRI